MKTIGLTGGIACGKSTVSARLEDLGAHIIDADKIAHELSAPGQEIYSLYVRHFGNQILSPDKTLDRRAIGAIVFRNPEEKQWMDGAIHPVIRGKMIDAIKRHRAEGKGVLVLDVPLLFEVGWQDLADENWVVFVPSDIQVRRLMERNRFTEAEAMARIKAQMPMSEKCRLADFVIDNSDSLSDTFSQIERLWKDRCHD